MYKLSGGRKIIFNQTIQVTNMLKKKSTSFKSYLTLNHIKKEIADIESGKVNSALLRENFTKRHIGPIDENSTRTMLKVVGVDNIDQLLEQSIPNKIRLNSKEKEYVDKVLGTPISEKMALEYISVLSKQNIINQNYIGCGFHSTFVPPVILRNLTENPGWYTSYTPYQAEISQGRLEGLLQFQTMISELTGLPFSNASLLDEATAAGESVYLAYSHLNGKRKEFFVDNDVYPFVKELIETRASKIGIKVIYGNINDHSNLDNKNVCGFFIQNPSNNGKVSDHSETVKKIKENGAIAICSADILSLLIVKSPGDMGFDICVGTTQRFGVPMMNGGPHAGFMSVKDELKRKIPGRVVGVSVDSNGNKAIRLSLQTREQHIRRERATSNICTAQALLANMSVFYAIFYGKKGLKDQAERVYALSKILTDELLRLNIKVVNKSSEIFDTVVIDCNKSNINSQKLLEFMYSKNINLRNFYDKNHVGISLNETVTTTDLNTLINYISEFTTQKNSEININFSNVVLPTNGFNKGLLRTSKFLEQSVFNSNNSETKFMRYLYHLQKKDYSLLDGMIPLGSCTLKLNAAAELIPITWPEFSNIHPFSPSNQRKGYELMIKELSDYLKAITQFDCVSLQPNSGANGEFAGILAIKRYFHSKGESNRNIVLIPSSAHGTNPATAAIAGMKVVVVNSDKKGNCDINDLHEKIAKHKKDLACIMITYPSTHGVFEEAIKDITHAIHEAGGQVYIDGANMNAQCLLTAPGVIGGDVCHLNLHKTFAIPHGGGGPGVGPICAKKHLEPFLPGHFELGNFLIKVQKML